MWPQLAVKEGKSSILLSSLCSRKKAREQDVVNGFGAANPSVCHRAIFMRLSLKKDLDGKWGERMVED